MSDRYRMRIDAHAGPLTSERIDQMMWDLADYAPTLSQHRGLIVTSITVPADTLRQAIATGVSVAEAALGTRAVAIEALTEDEHEIREGFEDITDIISVEDAAIMIGRSVQRVRQMVEEGKLHAERIGARTLVLSRREVRYRFGEEPLGRGTPVARVMSHLRGVTDLTRASNHELSTLRDILTEGRESRAGIAEYTLDELLDELNRIDLELIARETAKTV